MSSQQYSVYIPRMFTNITEEKIKEIFASMNVGSVSRVDFIGKTNNKGEKYNMVFVWFQEWFDNIAAQNLKSKIEDPNVQAKFVYEDPWFWIILPNTSRVESQDKTEKVSQETAPVQQPPMIQPPMMQPPMMMQHWWPMYSVQPIYYPQWNMHVPPLMEAPYGHGVMNAYYGPEHGFENPDAVEVSPEDEEMMNEIEEMMDRENDAYEIKCA